MERERDEENTIRGEGDGPRKVYRISKESQRNLYWAGVRLRNRLREQEKQSRSVSDGVTPRTSEGEAWFWLLALLSATVLGLGLGSLDAGIGCFLGTVLGALGWGLLKREGDL